MNPAIDADAPQPSAPLQQPLSGTAADEITRLEPELAQLKRQLNAALWAVLILALALGVGLGVEVWRLKAAAANSRLLLSNLQQIGSTVEEFRRLSARYPELAAIAKKHGLEPLPIGAVGAGSPSPGPTAPRAGAAPASSPAAPSPPIRR